MDSVIKLTDLPEDILVLIFPYLEPKDFLSLCSVNKGFHRNFYQSSEYWRERTANTFRTPIQPMLRADGTRWYWLYKNLRTRTKIYAWGSAHVSSGRHGDGKMMARRKITWPTKMVDMGPVADLQCGGWSTTMLTSDGVLYSVGILNTNHARRVSVPNLHPLKFPEIDGDGHEATAIRQFSSGRSQVLGLSDDGRIWSWEDSEGSGVCVKFTNVQISTGPPSVNRAGCVTKVIAGWNKSSAYIVGTGIIYWGLFGNRNPGDEAFTACAIVPGTDFQRPRSTRDYNDQDTFGEVRNYVVLEGYIVFITDRDKVYAFRTKEPSTNVAKEDVIELTTFSAEGREIKDIHGSFRKFAILTLSGEVLMGNEGMIDTFYNTISQEEPKLPAPNRPQSLQHTNVVSIAFGDHHFHALHAHGKISSHGVESKGCGSFGFGGYGEGENFRGVRYVDTRRPFHDNTLAPYAQETPRYIWFEPEKKRWLENLDAKANQGKNLTWNSVLRSSDSEISKIYNETIEREGEAWDDFPDLKSEKDYGLGAYFALTVAAGGWQSGALVLVNEDLAEKVRLKHTVMVEEKAGEKPRQVIGSPPPETDNTQSEEQGKRYVQRYKWEAQHFPVLDSNDPQQLRPVNDTQQIRPESYNWFRDWKYGMPQE